MTFVELVGLAATFLSPVGGSTLVIAITTGSRDLMRLAYALYAAAGWTGTIYAAFAHYPALCVFCVVVAAVATWLWWNSRRRGRRRALRELGYKARARIQALVDRMPPSPHPSPSRG